MENKTSRYTTIAGMFYYFGGYACMYYMPAFYQKVYPFFINEFAFINALSLFVFDSPSLLSKTSPLGREIEKKGPMWTRVDYIYI